MSEGWSETTSKSAPGVESETSSQSLLFFGFHVNISCWFVYIVLLSDNLHLYLVEFLRLKANLDLNQQLLGWFIAKQSPKVTTCS